MPRQVYVYACCEGVIRVGPFERVELLNCHTLVDQDKAVIARFEQGRYGEGWHVVCDERHGSIPFAGVTISSDPRLHGYIEPRERRRERHLRRLEEDEQYRLRWEERRERLREEMRLSREERARIQEQRNLEREERRRQRREERERRTAEAHRTEGARLREDRPHQSWLFDWSHPDERDDEE